MSENALIGGTLTGLGTPAALGHLAEAAIRDGGAAIHAVLEALSVREQLHAVAGDVARLRRVLSEHDYAVSTCDKYSRIVRNFLRAIGPGVPERSEVIAYLSDLSSCGRSNGTVRTRLCAIRAVFDGILGWGITAGIGHRPPPRPLAPASEAEAAMLRAAARTDCERYLIEALFGLDLMPHEVRMLGWRATETAAACRADSPVLCARVEQPAEEGRTLPFTVQTEPAAGTRWLFRSPCRPLPLSTRTLQRRIRSLAAVCDPDLEITCTALRLAGRIAALTGT